MGMILGLILAFTTPFVFLAIIYKLDFYQTGQFRSVLLSLAWGLVAYLLAVVTNRSLVDAGIADWDGIVRYGAPVLEEILKGLFLLYLVRRPQFTYSVDGAIYGFAAGIGFAVIENYEYVTGDPTIALAISFQRVFSTNLIHASSSAMIGIALGMFRLEVSRSRWLMLTTGVLLAIGQHMIFNNMITNGTFLIVAIGAGLLGAIFIYVAMRRGRKQAQSWIKEKLGMEDGVTSGEAAFVNRLDNLDEILKPIADRFGAEKATLVEEFLFIQARLGIKRKSLDSLDEKLSRSVEAEMVGMRADMDSIRREVGTYVMIFVRGTYTEDVISVWNQIQAKIQARSDANNGQKGGGLWTSLDNRVEQSLNPEGVD
jgi:RsiW-degrading membrane proteinase PrsW (M82 family)